MACNCKRALKLEEENGTEVKETKLQLTYRTLWKLIVLGIGVILGIVLVPVIILVLMYNQIFRGGKGITIPEKLSKYIM